MLCTYIGEVKDDGEFGVFLAFLGVFSGDLGVLLGCKITRGMIVVVGKVTERDYGGLRGF